MRSDASELQVRASNPAASTWLSANAGSGKTRVLTDRVARLLLGGVEPQRILCLTYTKAAATEMQNRLFESLGKWAMMPDEKLRDALTELGESDQISAGHLAKARRLFARAIETPGGLRIQTIHSFCATLLRRFPLEAGVSPQFTELDDRAARLLRSEIVEELAATLAPQVIADVALAYTGEDFTQLMEQVAGKRAGFANPLDDATVRALFEIPQGETEAAILADVFSGGEANWIGEVIAACAAGSTQDAKAAQKLAALTLHAPDMATLAALENVFLFGGDTKAPFGAKIGSFPTKATRDVLVTLMPDLNDLMERVELARIRRIALLAARKTLVLHRFAGAFLPVYEARKAARGWLDFDDLITRTKGLLTDPAVAAWVLFRLDGGIDHILVDEAQDTSPDQWRVIELLSTEFTAGIGTRDGGRTIFAVGDKKQSIYSFQGADVEAFDAKQAEFRTRFNASDQNFQTLNLDYSFRSSPAILTLVDKTFGTAFPEAVGHEPVSHKAFWNDMPGRVDLWPIIEPVKNEADENWEDPVDRVSETHHTTVLANQIASEIAAIIASGARIPTKDGPRPVHAGDFLVLVQRRSALFSEIIRACKKTGLPIAGADRLKLGAELAVKDLAALLSFLATPEDDLALAALLRSPLGGWTEAELYGLAQGRPGYLWEALRAKAAAFPETLTMLQDLRDHADFLRPFDLIERVLTRHDGRRRLLTRLGAEAEDGIDELRSQALAYERVEVPSLTGFLVWLETDEVEVKRQMDAEGHRIRVMTVHGAKGLEAPIVILPDTADRKVNDRDEIYTLADGCPVWKTAAAESPPIIAAIREERAARATAENLRLLYVAMTRARSWLIVACAGEAKTERKDGSKIIPIEQSKQCWYRQLGAGMQAVDTVPVGTDGRVRHSFGDWPGPVGHSAPPESAPPQAPDWSLRAAPARVQPAGLISPSDLGGAKVLPGETDGSGEAAAKARGTLLHRLLELMPTLPPAGWSALAERLGAEDLLDEAAAVIQAPHLGFLFGPNTLGEVALTAPFRGRQLFGVVDRLVIAADRVLAVDYKSNHLIPATPDAVPESLLRQMGAYALALGQIYPDRIIEVAILWTANGRVMPLDLDIVSAALARTTMDGVPPLDDDPDEP